DVDADRVLFIDADGIPISEDTAGAVFAKTVLKPGDLCVVPINSSGLIERVCRDAGARLEYCAVGQPPTLEAIKKLGAVYSYEESGKYYFPRTFLWPDGVYSAGRMLELMAKTGRSLAELASEFPRYHQVKKNVTVDSERQEQAMRRAAQRLEKSLVDGRTRDVTVDGFKRVYSDNSWLLFRKSGTEPLIRVYSDAPTGNAPRNSPPRGRRFCRRVCEGRGSSPDSRRGRGTRSGPDSRRPDPGLDGRTRVPRHARRDPRPSAHGEGGDQNQHDPPRPGDGRRTAAAGVGRRPRHHRERRVAQGAVGARAAAQGERLRGLPRGRQVRSAREPRPLCRGARPRPRPPPSRLRRADRPVEGDGRRLLRHRPDGAGALSRPHRRRKRHGQGTRRPRAPPQGAVRRDQLRRLPRPSRRLRALRPRQRSIHGRRARPRGPLRAGPRRNALPRRSRLPL